MDQVNTPYTLNSHKVTCQLHFNKNKLKKRSKSQRQTSLRDGVGGQALGRHRVGGDELEIHTGSEFSQKW